jgi:aspartyl/asparaginyl-tRNA synthetase
MSKSDFSARAILAGEAPQDAPVTVRGWVRTRRDSKAGISFVHLSDGSSFHPLQVVAPNTLANYVDEVSRRKPGCAVEATGTIVPSPAKGQPFEMQASTIKAVGWVEDPRYVSDSAKTSHDGVPARGRASTAAHERHCGGDQSPPYANSRHPSVFRQ